MNLPYRWAMFFEADADSAASWKVATLYVRRMLHAVQWSTGVARRTLQKRRSRHGEQLESRWCLSTCGVTSLGDVNSGIASVDAATGPGFILFSEESVHTRFPGVHSSNSDHLISVRHDSSGWIAAENETWVPFVPELTDRLIASVDFSGDTISSLQGVTGQFQGVAQGYAQGDLTFAANLYSGKVNKGEFTVGGTYFTVACPEIDVVGNGQSIVSGDDTPSVSDDTDWGTLSVGSGAVSRQFTIMNFGDEDLLLTGTPLVSLVGSSSFAVTQQPTSSVIGGQQSLVFEVTLDPTATGTQNATIEIASNDLDESLYTFALL
ncbi:MAG: choice-of-anchor D domain-containing protein, partial [Planctomycetales bacterium]|nr:choice-of-anchor D domain-containing protein [Planctomycetales bacterium]